MRPDDQARVFRPIWQGLEMARVTLDDLLEELEARTDLTTFDRLFMAANVVQIRAFIDCAGARFSHDGLESALENARGQVVTMPTVTLAGNAEAEAVADLYQKRPALQEKAKRRAFEKRGGWSAACVIAAELAGARASRVANVEPLARLA